ncbi:MAG: PAS domain S-box protein [Gammaproteobacteria bacterium]|nr:PAS domain S-box protein [Gammaproteobacteria bacterium]
MKPVAQDAGLHGQIVEQAPDALLLVDAAGTVVFANAAVSTLFGYESADLVGQGIEVLVPERSRGVHARLRTGFGAAPATREMGSRLVTLSGRRRDGSEFPAEIRLAPLRHGADQLVLAAVRDVTDRRRISEALAAARAAADSANSAKSRFLATASHDLRQPLQTLQLLGAALERRVTDTGLLDLLARQQAAIAAMGELLNSLLDITRLESGALQPAITIIPLADLLGDLQRQFEAIAASRRLTLAVGATQVCLRTDRVLLRQVLQNLLNNAFKFTREGGVTVAVAATADGIDIAVADTGIGISAADLERVFDEYYRVDAPGIEARGFGLGLTIVRQIARLLGYAVTAASQPGVGTTFTLRIPAAAIADGVGIASPAAFAAPQGSAAAKPALLVVEDDEPVREALALLLGAEGYPVRSAASAADAEALFAEQGGAIDLVVSDFHLEAGRTGAELVATLRAAADRDLPAVILSGDTTSAMEKVRSLPRSTLLRKPVDGARLVEVIEALFGASS